MISWSSGERIVSKCDRVELDHFLVNLNCHCQAKNLSEVPKLKRIAKGATRNVARCFLKLQSSILGVEFAIRYVRNPNPLNTVSILRQFAATIGKNSTFKRSVYLENVYEDSNSVGDFSNIQIAENCYLGDGVFMDLANVICLERDVVVSGQVSFVTHADCNRTLFLSQRFPRKCEPVKIAEGAWIGFGATILSGCKVGRNSVVGAGSVVTEDVEEYTVVAGIPAKPIRKLSS